jgi:hypothetical protein
MRNQQFAFAADLSPASALDILSGKSRIQPAPMRKRFPILVCLLWVVFAVPLLTQSSSSAVAQTSSAASARTVDPKPQSAAAERENYDPLLDLPPLPHNQVTLIGGTVVRLDEVMNRMVVEPFGSKQKLNVALDTRTHFYQNGKPVGERDMKQGQRVYLDTMLNGSKVFAKTIWIQTSVDSGIGQGQILEFDSRRQILTVRDALSTQPLKMHLSSATRIRKGDQPGSPEDLAEGSLVALSFGPQRELYEVNLLATPGATFTFAGPVTYLDMSQKMIAIDNRSDRKKYDVHVSAIPENVLRQVREGSDVDVSAVFDGNRYDARSVRLSNAAKQ